MRGRTAGKVPTKCVSGAGSSQNNGGNWVSSRGNVFFKVYNMCSLNAYRISRESYRKLS